MVTSRIAADVGGTFTDVVLVADDGRVVKAKVLSTPPDFEMGVLRGVRAVLAEHGGGAASVSALFHGTTVATNSLLESLGAKTALVTTDGFRDILEMTRGRRPGMYDLAWRKPAPLVPRRLRFEVEQRILSDGAIARPVSEDVAHIGAELQSAGVESVAVCLINSFLAPEEERTLAEALRRDCPALRVTASVDLDPEQGEYERTSTAVVNAYVAPAVDTYLGRIESGLQDDGIDAPFYVMQSSGGLLKSAVARKEPVRLIESGPAAGVIGTRALVRSLGIANAIAFDMGGTTAKATLIEDGEAVEASEYEVGGTMHTRGGLTAGGGYPVRSACLDIAEVGAGGGSIFWIDEGGSPRVGPRSAAASPGPACYGRGGELPTLSDAKLLLGYLSPTAIAGGTQQLHRELAHAAFVPVAEQLGLSVLDAAFGAFEIAIANMTRLLKAVTSERGRDPRDSTLVGFGGAGPAYATALASTLGIRKVLIPLAPGLFSAVGLLASDPQHDLLRPYLNAAIDPDEVTALFAGMESELVAALAADGYREDEIVLSRSADMRYAGQVGTLRLAVPSGPLDQESLAGVLDELDAEHLRTYGHRKARERAAIVNVRVRARCVTERLDPIRALADAARSGETGLPAVEREAYFGPEHGSLPTPIVERRQLDTSPRTGPLIVEEADSTIVVPPGATVALDDLHNLVITPA